MSCPDCCHNLAYYGWTPDPCPHNEDEEEPIVPSHNQTLIYGAVAYGALLRKNPLAVLRDWTRDSADPLLWDWAKKIFDDESKFMDSEPEVTNDRTTLPQIDIRK